MRNFVQEDQEQNYRIRAQRLRTQKEWAIINKLCVPQCWLWREFLFQWTPEMLNFHVNSLHNTLPDPNNLKQWGRRTESQCPLCSYSPYDAKHLLVVCQQALCEGRFTYRHDKVLFVVREALSLGLAVANREDVGREPRVRFINGRRTITISDRTSVPFFVRKATDWTILIDNDNRHYKFPEEIAETNMCPDLTAYSLTTKQVIIVELSVPWETNIGFQHFKKLEKYYNLESTARTKGFYAKLFAVEIGARGMPSKNMNKFLEKLGLGREKISEFLNRMSRAALSASYYIWIKRNKAYVNGDWNVCNPPGGSSVQGQ